MAVSGWAIPSVKVAKDLAGHVFPTGFLVVHDTRRGRENHKAERTSGKHRRNPALDLVQGNGVAGRNNAALVDTANELDDNLAGTVVVNDLKVANVACKR